MTSEEGRVSASERIRNRNEINAVVLSKIDYRKTFETDYFIFWTRCIPGTFSLCKSLIAKEYRHFQLRNLFHLSIPDQLRYIIISSNSKKGVIRNFLVISFRVAEWRKESDTWS